MLEAILSLSFLELLSNDLLIDCVCVSDHSQGDISRRHYCFSVTDVYATVTPTFPQSVASKKYSRDA